MAKLKVQTDVKPFTMIKNAILDSENILSDHEKLLYIVLLRYGNKAFPSLATLSRKCGFSKRTVQRTIDTLTEKGLLKKRNRVSKKSGNTSNVYTLIDNDRIWKSTEENLKENMNAAKLEEAIKIVELAGMKVSGKEKGLDSEPTKAHYQAPQTNNIYIDNDSTNKAKSQVERYTMEDVRALFEYDSLIIQYPAKQTDIDIIFNILYDTLNTKKTTIRIGRQDKPAMVVIGKFMKLNKESIMYAIRKFSEQTDKINNPIAYMTTILYTAQEQCYLDMKNQVNKESTKTEYAIKENNTPVESRSAFHNFKQRTYDYDKLEQELLRQ